MHLYCDHPGNAAPFLAEEGEWDRVRVAELPAEDRNALRVLAGDSPIWTSGNARECAGPLLIIDSAATSQFSAVQKALQAGVRLPDGLACIALEGRGFVGQRGRAWTALRGNLHLSAYFSLHTPAHAMQCALTALPAVAAAEAIDAVAKGSVRAEIKWVNDVMVLGRKVGGVLTATHVQGAVVRHVIFGIGINVARCPHLDSAPFVTPPTCLADADPALADALPQVLWDLLRRVRAGVEDVKRGAGDEWIERYRGRCMVVGRKVSLWPEEHENQVQPSPLARGRVLELLSDLSLRLEHRPEPVRHGRLIVDNDEQERSEPVRQGHGP